MTTAPVPGCGFGARSGKDGVNRQEEDGVDRREEDDVDREENGVVALGPHRQVGGGGGTSVGASNRDSSPASMCAMTAASVRPGTPQKAYRPSMFRSRGGGPSPS